MASPSSVPQPSQMQKPSRKHYPVIPSKMELSFPLLKSHCMKTEDYEKLEARLYHQTLTIMEKFAYTFTNFFQSLSDREIPVKVLVAYLKTYGAFTRIYKGEYQPLLRDEFGKLNLETADMDDLMMIVTDYCSFFNFRLLSYLVGKYGKPSDHEELERYEEEFAEYSKRRIYKCPSEIKPINEECANLVLKLDHSYEQCCLDHIKLLEFDLSTIFDISNLNLCRVDQGCLQLTFQLPLFVQEAVFPLSREQEEKLKALHVLRVDCGDYHFSSDVSMGSWYRGVASVIMWGHSCSLTDSMDQG